jgi:pyridoxine 4-dehydrogenase
MLTGNVKTVDDVKHLGRVAEFPRFQALEHNLKLVEVVQDIAAKKGCSAAQIAIAWVRSVGDRPGSPTVIPLPGATTVARVDENTKLVKLTKDEQKALDELADTFEVAGGRYPDGLPIEL